MRSTTDVLIVGAGPVGLLLACELQRQGVDYLLIERVLERSYFCKALGVTARTLELFDSLGIAGEAIDSGVWICGRTNFENGVETGSREHEDTGLPYGSLAIPQYETERILQACLNRHGGNVSRGLTLKDFTTRADRVTARIEGGTDGAIQVVQSRWLVGCDGARSAVRKGLGLEFEGDRYPMNFMLGDVELEWNLPRGRVYRFIQTVEGQMRNGMVAVPVRGSAGRYRLSMGSPEAPTEEPVRVGSELSKPPTVEEITAIAEPMLPPGTTLSQLRWSSVYSISHRIVPRYSIGNVLLAGDAAHIHPPIGGLGMNTGLQDAHNLSWKLALVSRGIAGTTLLDSYSSERYPVGMDVVNETSRAMDQAVSGGWRSSSAEARDSQLFIGYRSSVLVQDDVPLNETNIEEPHAGDRAPDATGLSRPFVAHRSRLRERIELGYHVLIGYTSGKQIESDQRSFASLLAIVRKHLGSSCSGLAIIAPDAEFIDCELMPLFVDQDSTFQRVYAARSGMVWLVRPDGHIAWRCDRADAERLARFIDRIAASRS